LARRRACIERRAEREGFGCRPVAAQALHAFGQSAGEYRRERASSPIRIADVNATETAGQAVTAAKNG
jgi:hypothetical protein